MGVGSPHLSKGEFSKSLKQVWLNINSANIIKRFSSTGLFPLGKSKICENWCDAKQLKRYKLHMRTIKSVRVLPPPVLEPIWSGGSDRHGGGDFPDVPLDLSLKNRPVIEEGTEDTSVKSIIQVFRESITTLEATPSSSTTGAGTRLKHDTYGEVLTSVEVLSRLKETEKKKATKRSNVSSSKRGRPKKIRPSVD